MSQSVVMGFDLGGTNLRVAAVTPGGTVCYRQAAPLPDDKSPEQIIALMKDLLHQAVAKVKGDFHIRGIGIGAPGGVYPQGGIVTQSPHLPLWKNVPLARRLREDLRLPVWVDNDANCFALGESHFGSAFSTEEERKCFLALTLGTGIGGAMMVDGKVWHGLSDMAGEFGHMVIALQGTDCACGGRGCLETFSSGSALIRRAKEEIQKGRKSLLVGLNGLDGQAIGQAAEKGDALSLELFSEMGFALGIGIANLVNMTGIPRVVIGGKVIRSWDFFLPALFRAVKTQCFREVARKVRVEKATLGDDAGILGAASLVWKNGIRRATVARPLLAQSYSITP